MSTGTFDLYQQVFALSMLANADSDIHGSTETLRDHLAETLASHLGTAELQALIGSSWTVAWGPCVYERASQGKDSQVADNAMFVAHNTASNTYVVAIAATNGISIFDLLKEDVSVGRTLAWPYGKAMPPGSVFPSGVAIAAGTGAGVEILQQMRDSGGRSLAAFLQSVQSTSATLVFTGHSLGGALAPTLACALVTQGALAPGKWAQVSVYPTAGPTPGNGAFAALFKALFPQTAVGAQPWQAWNSLLWNSLDIVPHAWNSATLKEIPGLYRPAVTAGPYVLGLVRAAEALAFLKGYEKLPAIALAGQVVDPQTLPPVPSRGLLPPIDGDNAPFLVEAYYQHIGAYFSLLGVQSLRPLLAPKVHAAAPVEARIA